MALTSRAVGGSLAILAAAWLTALVWAPIGASERWSSWRGRVAGLVYVVGAAVCHQRPERSFSRGGRPLPVCGRCLGLYVGGLLGLSLGALWRSRPAMPGVAARRLLAVAALPTVATVAIEWWGPLTITNLGRALAAIPLAAVAGWMLGTATWAAPADRVRAGA